MSGQREKMVEDMFSNKDTMKKDKRNQLKNFDIWDFC